MNDLNWYLLALLIMGLIFLCGYKIGNWTGWHRGFNASQELEAQHAMAKWRRDPLRQNAKSWDYQPAERKTAPKLQHSDAVSMTQ